jgi:hypothetical protein
MHPRTSNSAKLIEFMAADGSLGGTDDGEPIEKLTVERLYRIFSQANRDCADSGEPMTSFDDEEACADQIFNMFDVTPEEAMDFAVQLKAYAKEQNYQLPLARRRRVS